MYQKLTIEEKESRKNSYTVSSIIHLMVLLILFLPIIASSNIFSNEYQGIIVALGVPDAGEQSSEDTPMESTAMAMEEVVQEEPIEKAEEVEEAEEVKKPKETPKIETQKEVQKETKPVAKEEPEMDVVLSELTQVESQILAVDKPIPSESEARQKEIEKSAQEDAEKIKEEKERQEKEQKEEEEKEAAERKIKEEKERQAKLAAQKAKELDEKKSAFGDLFDTSSKGTTSAPKGQENGDPNSDILEGISTGTGRDGEGLGARGIVYSPDIVDNSQKTGIVSVKICVDSSGKVISSQFTQKGSTTTDQYLVDLAVKNAKKYQFSESTIEEQCGSITINFLLQ